jgi:hypothetical protein
MTSDYTLSHTNETNIYRDSNGNNVECKLKFFIHKKVDIELLEESEKNTNNNVDVVPKKSLKSFQEVFLEKFNAIPIYDVLKTSYFCVKYSGTKKKVGFGYEIDSDLKQKKFDEKLKASLNNKKFHSIYDIADIPAPSSQLLIHSNRKIDFDKYIVFEEIVSTSEIHPRKMTSANQILSLQNNVELKVYILPNFEYVLELKKDLSVITVIPIYYPLYVINDTNPLWIYVYLRLDSQNERDATIIFDSKTRSKKFMKTMNRILSYENLLPSRYFLLNSNFNQLEKIETSGKKITITSFKLEKFYWHEIQKDKDRKFYFQIMLRKTLHKTLINLNQDLIQLDENILMYRNLRFTFLRKIDAEMIYDQLLKIGIIDNKSYFSCFCRFLFQKQKLNLYGKISIDKYENQVLIMFKTSNSKIIFRKNYKQSHIENCKNPPNAIRYLDSYLEFLYEKDKKSFIQALQEIDAEEFYRKSKSFSENINKKIINKFC